MTTTGDQLFGPIAIDVAAALTAEGERIVAAKRQDLSVPVGTARGPKGQRLTVRSKPGEPPRRETGRLQAGFQANVATAALASALTITDPVPYAVPLQQSMRRIVTSDVDARFGDRVLDAVAAAITGGEP
jgi:hypothetical protein